MTQILRFTAVIFLVLIATVAVAQSASAKLLDPTPFIGLWHALVKVEPIASSPAFESNFDLRVAEKSSGELHAELINGKESEPFSRVEWKDGVLHLYLDHYEGELELTVEGSSLNGYYSRATRKGGKIEYRVTASRGFELKAIATDASQPTVNGDWLFEIAYEGDKSEKIPAHFIDTYGVIEGTLAILSGDLGNLHGGFDGKRLTLDRFDGIHIIHLEAEVQADNSLRGKLQEPGATIQFTATRHGAEAASEELETQAEQLTSVKDPQQVFHFSGVDLATGKTVTEKDFAGKAVILDVFGTWCPNCHDEAPLLVDLYKRHHAEGLAVVGLAYEYTDEAVRSRKLLGIFGKKYGIEFSLLLGGATDGAEKSLPQLVNFGAFPTTIFIGRDGRVHAIHAGFEGEATGQLRRLRERFEQLTAEILK